MATHKEKVSPPPRNQTTLPQPRTSASGPARSLRNRVRGEKDKAPTRSKYFECSGEDELARNHSAQHEDTGLEKTEDVMHVEDDEDWSDKDKASMRSRTGGNKRKPGIALQRVDKQRKKARPTTGYIPEGSPTRDSEDLDAESGNGYRDNMIHPNTMAFLKGKKFTECYLLSKSNHVTWRYANPALPMLTSKL